MSEGDKVTNPKGVKVIEYSLPPWTKDLKIPLKRTLNFVRRIGADGLVLEHINSLRKCFGDFPVDTIEQGVAEFARKEFEVTGGGRESVDDWLLRQVRTAMIFAGKEAEMHDWEIRVFYQIKRAAR